MFSRSTWGVLLASNEVVSGTRVRFDSDKTNFLYRARKLALITDFYKITFSGVGLSQP